MKDELKIVIDGDTMKCVEKFYQSETDKIIEKYENMGRWDDVSVDHNGDIILWEDL